MTKLIIKKQQKNILLLIFCLIYSPISIADHSDSKYDIRQLYSEGKISSLEFILQQLSHYKIERVLEIELKQNNQKYIYEFEYLNNKGNILELEVDALTAEVIKFETIELKKQKSNE